MGIRDAGTQATVILGLPAQLTDFPPRILETGILPSVSSVCLLNPALWIYALPLHVYLSGRIPGPIYQRVAGPFIAQGLAVTNPAETMTAFLKHILFIQEHFSAPFYAVSILI